MGSKAELILVDAKKPPEIPEYQLDHGVVPMPIFWGFIVVMATLVVWGGGILWWVAGLNAKVQKHDEALKQNEENTPKREAVLLEKIDAKFENAVLRIENNINCLRTDVEHLYKDFQAASDARSQTLAGQGQQIIRQGKENNLLMAEVQQLRGRVNTLSGIIQGGAPSKPGSY